MDVKYKQLVLSSCFVLDVVIKHLLKPSKANIVVRFA
jgi:hypothetical protein